APVAKERGYVDAFAEQRRAVRVVDGAAAVGIDETLVPQLRPLLKVRNAGRRRLQHHLRQRVEKSGEGDAAVEALEVGAERLVLQQRRGVVEKRALVVRIRRDPRRERLRLARGFLDILAKA